MTSTVAPVLLRTQEVLVTFRVYAIPRPQGSKRHVGRGIMVEASRHVGQWRNDVMSAAQQAYQGPPLTCDIDLELWFWFPRSKSHYGTGKNADRLKPSAPEKPSNRTFGDLSKLIRSTEDAISASSGYPVIADDSLVTDLTCKKRYATHGCPPGALVTIRMA